MSDDMRFAVERFRAVVRRLAADLLRIADECQRCQGRGRVPSLGPVHNEMTCPDCHGTGSWPDEHTLHERNE